MQVGGRKLKRGKKQDRLKDSYRQNGGGRGQQEGKRDRVQARERKSKRGERSENRCQEVRTAFSMSASTG